MSSCHSIQRILIVDDEPYNILSLQLLFRQVGYNMLNNIADRAYNGKHAINIVQESLLEGKHIYSLIFMDLSMPIVDGFVATKRIRQFYKQHKVTQPFIVACTGHVEYDYIKQAWHSHMDEVAPKPIDLTLLKAIIEENIKIEWWLGSRHYSNALKD